MAEQVRYALGFHNSEGSSVRDERGFPQHDYWHPDKEAAEAAARRVLRELADRGDTRWWGAYHADPIAVGANRAPGTIYRVTLEDD